jgi:hypothetical protein
VPIKSIASAAETKVVCVIGGGTVTEGGVTEVSEAGSSEHEKSDVAITNVNCKRNTFLNGLE